MAADLQRKQGGRARLLWKRGCSVMLAVLMLFSGMWGAPAETLAREDEQVVVPTMTAADEPEPVAPGVMGPETPEKKWEIVLPRKMRADQSVGNRQGAAYPLITFGPNGVLYAGVGSVNELRFDGSTKWETPLFTSEEMGRIRHTIGGASTGPDGTVYVTSIDTYQRLIAVAPDGTIKWKRDTPLLSGPYMAVNGNIYVLGTDGKLREWTPEGTLAWTSGVNVKGGVAVGPDGAVYALGTEDEVYRIMEDGTTVLLAKVSGVSGLTVGPDGAVYVFGDDSLHPRKLVALNADGTIRWQRSNVAAAWVRVLDDGALYTGGSTLHALNPDGSQKWRLDPEPLFTPPGGDSPGLYYTGAAIGADGTLYTALNQHNISYPSVGLGINHHVDGRLLAVSPDGKIKWIYNHGFITRGPVLGPDGTLYAMSDLRMIALGNSCTPFAKTSEWTIRADRCFQNADGTMTFSGNIRINSFLRLTADAIVDTVRGEIRSKGKLYAPLATTETGQTKQDLTKEDVRLTSEGVLNAADPFKVGQKLMLGGVPFVIDKLWWEDAKLYADLEVNVLGQKLKAEKTELLSGSLNLEVGPFPKAIKFNNLELREIKLSYNWTNGKLTTEATVGIPRIGKLDGLMGRLGFQRGQLNQVGVGFDLCREGNVLLSCGIPIGNSPFLITYVEGEVNNFRATTDPLELTAKVKIQTADVQLSEVPMLTVDVTGKWDMSWKASLEGTAKLFMFDLAQAAVELSGQHMKVKASAMVVLFFNAGATATVTWKPKMSLTGSAVGQIQLPIDFPLFVVAGKSYGKVGATLNEEKLVLTIRPLAERESWELNQTWKDRLKVTIEIKLSDGSVSVKNRSMAAAGEDAQWQLEQDGYQVEAGTNLTRIEAGGKRKQTLRTLADVPAEEFVLDGAENEVMIYADWEEGDGPVKLIAPSGAEIEATEEGAEEGGLAAIRFGQEAYFFLDAPEAGTYRVEYDSALSGFRTEAYGINAEPTFTFTDVQYDGAAQQVDLAWNVQDREDTPIVTFYYDDDNAGADGVPIEGEFVSADGMGSFSWDVANLPHGTYWVYAMVDDGRNAPVIVYADQPVTHIQASAPQSPAGLVAQSRNGGIELNWAAVPGAEVYLITVIDEASGERLMEVSAEGPAAFISSESIAPGVYRVQVEAETAEGVPSLPTETTVEVVAAAPLVLEPHWSNDTGLTSTGELSLQLAIPAGATADIYHQGESVRTGLSGEVAETFILDPDMNEFVIRATNPAGDEGEVAYSIYYDDLAPVLDLEPLGYETAGGQAYVRIQGWTSSANRLTVDGAEHSVGAEGSIDIRLPEDQGKVKYTVRAVSPSGQQTVHTLSPKDRPVDIPDAALEAALRMKFGKPVGPLTIGDLEQMVEADFTGQGIRNIAGLEYAVNLTLLLLNDNPLAPESLALLAGMTQLQQLELDETGIDDLSFVQNLHEMIVLSVAGNPIESLTPLAGMMKLSSLHASGTRLNEEDLEGLDSFPLLASLLLDRVGLTSVELLRDVETLRTLSLADNLIEDVGPLGSLEQLSGLYLNGNRIRDVEPLSRLTELDFMLELSDNPLQSVDGLGALTKLRQLHLDRTGITDISGLAGMTGLEYLWVEDNQIESIEALDGMVRLATLLASGNKIKLIGVLLELPALQGADIHDNPLLPAAEPHIRALQAKGVSLVYDEIFVVRGRVTQMDREGNELPLSGAEVSVVQQGGIIGRTVMTDSNGWYQARVPSGTYEIRRVEHDGQVMVDVPRGSFRLIEEQEVVYDIRLPANNVSGRIQVQGGDWAMGPGQAVVYWSDENEAQLYRVNIREDGTFSALFGAGDYEIQEVYVFDVAGERQLYAMANVPFTVVSEEELVMMEFSIIPVNVFGRVTEEGTGRAMGPGFLTISPSTSISAIELDADGKFGYSLPSGRYEIGQFYLTGVNEGKDLHGYLNHSFEVTDTGTPLDLQLVLRQHTMFKGTLKFADERAIPFGALRLRLVDEAYREFGTYVETNGGFNVYLPVGSYRLLEAIMNVDGNVASYPLSGQRIDITETMTAPATAAIVVQTDPGQPPGPALEVRVTEPAGQIATNAAVPVLKVRTADGVAIRVLLGGQEIGSGVGAGDRDVEIPLGALAEGAYRLVVKVKDAEGREAEAAVPEITVDRTPPAAPTVVQPTGELVTKETLVKVTVKAEHGSTISIRKGTEPMGGSRGEGNTPVELYVGRLSRGANEGLTVTAMDAAGNVSAATALPVIRVTDEDPGTGNPGTGNPGTGNPGTGNPGTSNSGAGNPSPSGSGAGDIGIKAPATLEREGGREVAKVSIDSDKLQQAFSQLDSGVKKPRISIEVEGSHPAAKVEIPGDALGTAARDKPDAVLSIQSGRTSYDLPVAALQIDELAARMGVAANDLKVSVAIEELAGDEAAKITAAARDSGMKLVGSILSFRVSVEAAGRSEAIESFGGTYITRTITLNGPIDTSRATGVLYDPETGSLSFVPAVFTTINGVTTAALMRNGNSIYTVVELDKTFEDIAGHWAKADIELLASKLIAGGISEQEFAPEKSVTRAEFASLLVRSLGLTPDASAAAFSDVDAADWFAGAVGAAVHAGLVEGNGDGTFRPQAEITREQMAVMITRALKVAGAETKTNREQKQLLEKFRDRGAISTWSAEAVEQALAAGIVQGVTDDTFEPAANASRAQAAVMLRRMLQYVKFIN